jgi:hypothetical protein
MGANAQTSVPAFTAGQILTAEQVTQINTGIPVFATTTTRDAAFGGTSEKTLAQGQMAFIEATNTTQYYNGSAWVTLGASGLTLVSATTVGTAVSSVTVSNCFSSTYDNYKITLVGGTASTNLGLRMTLGASTASYYTAGITSAWGSSTLGAFTGNNIAYWDSVGYGEGSANAVMNMEIQGPNIANLTYAQTTHWRQSGALGQGMYFHNVAAAYTGFTITTSTGTLTGGTIRVYGYANS